MVDITARIVWYKLTEKYTDVCEKYDRFLDWYEDFSWSRVDILDMLFLGWLLAAFVVVGAINLYLRFFGHPKSKRGIDGGGSISAKNGEGLEWLNSAISWLFQHYNNTPEFVDAWIRALNEQARKQQLEYEIKIDGIQTGSPPPKLKHVATDSSSKDYLTIQAGVESDGQTTLLVSAIQKSATSIRVTNCDVAILKLKGQLKVNSTYNSSRQEISINLCFATTPEITLQVRPKQIDSKVKLKEVEDAVKNIICSSVTTVTLPSTGGYPNFYPGLTTQTADNVGYQQHNYIQPEVKKSTAPQDFTAAVRDVSSPVTSLDTNTPFQNEPMIPLETKTVVQPHMFEPLTIDVSKYESVKNEQLAHEYIGNGSASNYRPKSAHGKKQALDSQPSKPAQSKESQIEPTKVLSQSNAPTSLNYQPQRDYYREKAASPGGTLKNRKLLVKVIKANGLGDKDFACHGPYCTVQTDEPQQRHITSVVKNTVNPFWDEHFVFDLNDDTKNVKFEVYDREKTPGTDFLGRANIPMNELKRLPSSRQIIPLTGKPGSTTTSGSVTVEFLFMDTTPESQQPFSTVNKQDMDGISPRRRIETNRTVTPGGTHVTTTTTTTERPRDRLDQSFNEMHMESPNRIQKSETSSNYTGEYSPYSSRSSHLGAHEAGLTASQQAPVANRPSDLGSPALTLTHPAGSEHNLDQVIPIIQTTEPGDMHDYNRSISPSETSHSRAAPQSASTSESDAEVKKSKSFASTLKRKFQRNKDKSKRSQSADRASSFRDQELLRPPEQRSGGGRLSVNFDDVDVHSEYSTQSLKREPKRASLRNFFRTKDSTKDDMSGVDIPEAGLQKNRQRSRSFSSSLKKLFKGKKKDGVSRESSVSRQSTRSAQGALTISREGSLQPSPQIYRQSSPTAGSPDFPYSSSVPAGPSPLYDQYSAH